MLNPTLPIYFNDLGCSKLDFFLNFRYVMKYLEISGVNFNAVDKNLQTPLHICCIHGHVDAFKFLIKAEVIFKIVIKEMNNLIYYVYCKY